MTQAPTHMPPPAARRYDLDLLYIVILGGVIVSHALMIFSPGPYLPPYPIKNATLSREIGWVCLYTGITAMPVFFLLSGWTSLAALRRVGWSDYVSERAKRLLVPLLVGMAVFGPVMKYYELSSGIEFVFKGPRVPRPFDMSFWEFLPRAYWFKHITWFHLYFLVYLFAISVLTYPVLRWLVRREATLAARPRPKTAEAPETPAPVWLAYVPLAPATAVLVVIGGWWPYYPTLVTDWRHLLLFGSWFVMGGVMAISPRLEAAVKREWWRLWLLGMAGYVVHVAWPEELPGWIGAAFSAWGGFGGLLGLVGLMRLKGGPLLKYMRDATLPVYIIHNLFIMVLGFYVVRTDWSLAVKFVVILTIGLGATFVVYHYLVKPLPLLRFIFGLRPLKRPEKAAQPA